MAEISKLSGVAIANVAKVDAVTKANIANINGLTIPGGLTYTPPLDTYTGAAVAFSVRLLRTAYTGSCLRVRRESDDAETDIGFDSAGLLDTAAIATHCGSSTGHLVYWYDQSGNGNDAFQSSASAGDRAIQPLIYDGSAVYSLNSKPALYFNGGDYFTGTLSAVSQTGRRNEFAVASFESTLETSKGGIITQDIVDGGGRICQNICVSNSNLQSTNIAGGIKSFNGSTTLTTDQQYLFSVEQTATALIGYVNGTQDATVSSSGSTGSSKFSIGYASANAQRWYGNIQEIIMYNSDKSSDRSNIESNIDSYFSIP